MKTLKKFLLIPLFAIVCMFARIDSAVAVDYPFSVTTSSVAANGVFEFTLSAKGTFYVDCGTGGTLGSDNSTANGMISGGTINKTNTTKYTFKCTYSSSGTKTIRFGGTATQYNANLQSAPIGFKTTTAQALITSISGDLSLIFSYISSSNGYFPRFYETFYQCKNLTSIPGTLFSHVTASGAYIFAETFYGTGITSIPENLFSFSGNNVSGKNYMFNETFRNTGITSIPENLFSHVTGGAQSMFSQTFYGCTGLTSIPGNLFSHVTSGAQTLFYYTFYGCSGLTGYIPPTLFSGLIANGSPEASEMMTNVFGSTGLATSCPSGMEQYVTGYEDYWVDKVSCSTPITCSSGYYLPVGSTTCTTCISGSTCPGGTFGFNATMNQGISIYCSSGYYLPANSTSCATCLSGRNCPGGSFIPNAPTDQGIGISCSSGYYLPANSTSCATCSSDYTCPGGLFVASAPADQGKIAFTVNTINIDKSQTFSFNLRATGTYYVDCDTGGTLSAETDACKDMILGRTITKTTFPTCKFLCKYSSGGIKTIRFGGTATQYDGATPCTVQFSPSNELITSISGDLSLIFPLIFPLDENYQPIFWRTFRDCTLLTSIPETLFSHYTNGNIMFQQTFEGCTGLTSIPENLFSFGGNNVSGRDRMFLSTFRGCTGLTSLPANLFSHITGSKEQMFSQTFYNCSGLTGYIPPSMFSGLIANGSPYSGSGSTGTMYNTFNNTGSLRTSCPSGTTQYITGYEDYWDGHVSCGPSVTCSNGYYLPANTSSCATCPSGETCPGGTFAANAPRDQGKVSPIALTWYDGNSTISGPTSCAVGGVFLPPTPPARTGYIFNGWKIKSVNP